MIEMANPAQRMKAMRERRRTKGLREVRLVVPDARDRPCVRVSPRRFGT